MQHNFFDIIFSIKIKISLIAIAAILISGCSKSAINEFNEKFDESLHSSFKSSFVESCFKNGETGASEEQCSCLADDLLSNLSKSELTDTDKVKERLNTISLDKCMGPDGAG